jgi:hypothetical protein
MQFEDLITYRETALAGDRSESIFVDCGFSSSSIAGGTTFPRADPNVDIVL